MGEMDGAILWTVLLTGDEGGLAVGSRMAALAAIDGDGAIMAGVAVGVKENDGAFAGAASGAGVVVGLAPNVNNGIGVLAGAGVGTTGGGEGTGVWAKVTFLSKKLGCFVAGGTSGVATTGVGAGPEAGEEPLPVAKRNAEPDVEGVELIPGR